MPPKSFALTRWVVDETVSVMPLTAVKKGQTPHVGAFVDMKYIGKLYEAEILMISENRPSMLKICDDLVTGKVSREEILDRNTTEVDSTTDTEAASPVKKIKVTKKSASKKSDKTKGKAIARIEAAKSRAKAIFANTIASSLEEDDKSICDTASDTSTTELQRQLALQRQEIENLQRKLQRTSPPVVVTKNVVSHSKFDSLQKNYVMPHKNDEDFSSLSDAESTQFDEMPWKFDKSPTGSLREPASQTPSSCRRDLVGQTSSSSRRDLVGQASSSSRRDLVGQTPSYSREDPADRKSDETNSHSPKDPANRKLTFSCDTPTHGKSKVMRAAEDDSNKANKVELVPGYGVYITAKQLDLIKSNSNSATKLLRNLLMAFFTPQTLATSSALGSRKNQPLDKCILDACFRFVQLQYEGTPRTILVDATNDKCAQCRRKRKTSEL